MTTEDQEKEEAHMCRNCLFCFPIESQGYDKGFCQRYPPTVTGHNYDEGAGLYMGSYPTVFLDNWCGEWK